jgi:hypothetical protein
MLSGTQLDAAIEQALHGATVSDEVAPFAGFVDDLNVMADRPAPRPSAELAALLAGHAAQPGAGATVTSLRPRQRRRVPARAAMRLRVAKLGLAGKAAMIIALATTAVAGAAAGILPEPATRFVQRVIEVVTPFELPATGQDAPNEGAKGARAADKPGHTSPEAVAQPAPTVHRPDITRTSTLDGEALPDTTALAGPSSATTTGNPVARPAEHGAPTPRGDSDAPTAPDPSEDSAKGRPPDHEPPAGPAPKNDHVPPGQALPGASHPGGGRPGDAPPAGSDSDPEPLSAPKGCRSKGGSPGGPPQAPDRQGDHHGRPAGSGPGHDTAGQTPTEPHSKAPGKPQSNGQGGPDRPYPFPDGEPGRATDGQERQDPAPPAADGRGASDRSGPHAPGGEAPNLADGRSNRDIGPAPATGASSSATPPSSA